MQLNNKSNEVLNLTQESNNAQNEAEKLKLNWKSIIDKRDLMKDGFQKLSEGSILKQKKLKEYNEWLKNSMKGLQKEK